MALAVAWKADGLLSRNWKMFVVMEVGMGLMGLMGLMGEYFFRDGVRKWKAALFYCISFMRV